MALNKIGDRLTRAMRTKIAVEASNNKEVLAGMKINAIHAFLKAKLGEFSVSYYVLSNILKEVGVEAKIVSRKRGEQKTASPQTSVQEKLDAIKASLDRQESNLNMILSHLTSPAKQTTGTGILKNPSVSFSGQTVTAQ